MFEIDKCNLNKTIPCSGSEPVLLGTPLLSTVPCETVDVPSVVQSFDSPTVRCRESGIMYSMNNINTERIRINTRCFIII